MNNEKQYYAFISYKREDKKEATRLQHTLEYYKLPNNLRQENPDLPEYVRPIFRDMTDLEVGELSTQIHEALEQSHYLIVICSPRAAKSKWVNDEIEYFISIGKQDKIIPFIIDGLPHSDNPEEECYPPALLAISKEKELLGANINEVGKESAAIRVVSRMFNIRFDSLWQRYQRDQRKRTLWLSCIGIALFLLLIGIAIWIFSLYLRSDKQNRSLLIQQERLYANIASKLIEESNPLGALILLNELTDPKGAFSEIPLQAEAEYQMRNAIYAYDKSYWKPIDILRENNSYKFSPKGNYLATPIYGDLNSYIQLINADTYEEYKLFPCSQNRPIRYDISKDDELLAITSGQNIYIYDIETGEKIKEFRDTIPYSSICDIKFFTNNIIVYTTQLRKKSTQNSSTLHVYNLELETTIHHEFFEEKDAIVNAIEDIQFSDDCEKCLIIADIRKKDNKFKYSNIIRILDTHTWKQIYEYIIDEESIDDEESIVRFYDNDNFIIGNSLGIYKINLTTKQKSLFSTFKLTNDFGCDICVTDNKKSIVVCCGHRLAHIDAENGKELGSLYNSNEKFHGISMRDSIFVTRISKSNIIYKIPKNTKAEEYKDVFITIEKKRFITLQNDICVFIDFDENGYVNNKGALRIADRNNKTIFFDDEHHYTDLLTQEGTNSFYTIAYKDDDINQLVYVSIDNDSSIQKTQQELDINKIFSIKNYPSSTKILCAQKGELCEWNTRKKELLHLGIPHVYKAIYNPKKDRILIIDSLGSLTQINFREQQTINTRLPVKGVRDAKYTCDGEKIVVITNNTNHLLLINSMTMEIENDIKLNSSGFEIIVHKNWDYIIITNNFRFYRIDMQDFKIRERINIDSKRGGSTWSISNTGKSITLYSVIPIDYSNNNKPEFQDIPLYSQQEMIEKARQIVGNKERKDIIQNLNEYNL